MARERLDVVLCERGLAPSRVKAQALIRGGSVRVGGVRVDKPSALIDPAAAVDVAAARHFVSRGGDKLDAAIESLGIDVHGTVVVDVGASTGGFTDCVLSRGARRVYAVDVGHGQLAKTLCEDPRVVASEGRNARHLRAADFPEPVDMVLVDASFISLDKLADALADVVRPGGRLVALVKPQFEVGRDAARRTRGVVREREERDHAIATARAALVARGFDVLGECDSAVPGPRGNVEHFVYARRRGT